MGSTGNELAAMKEIYQLDAGCEQLEVLAVREINKLEERYFTPALQKEKGGSSFYYYWEKEKADSVSAGAAKETRELALFLNEVGNNKTVRNPGLLETGAAYTAYMLKDYPSAKNYLAAAKKMNLSQKLKDQCALTNILISINESEQMNTAFEEQLLPSLQWLLERARDENGSDPGAGTGQWKKIYRDLLSEILSRRYHAAAEYYKEALCIGAADKIELASLGNPDDAYSRGIHFMRNNLTSKDVEKLYALMTSEKRSKFEHFLIRNNSIKPSAVADFAGTAYLREYDYANAIKWFKKSPGKKSLIIHKNPFIALLYDQEEQLPAEATFSTSKLAFAETMLQLTRQAAADKVNAGKYYYKIANALYNMTYYGHAWELVQYDRSGSDGYSIPKDGTPFQKEYYGCFAAQAYFEKAMNASTDKNFRARCLFMMAKCSQKQLSKPVYSDFNYNYDKLEEAQNVYWEKFRRNVYFPQLAKEYSGTAFYREAFSSCSFLRDFVKKKK